MSDHAQVAMNPVRERLIRSLAHGPIDRDALLQLLDSKRPEDSHARRTLSLLEVEASRSHLQKQIDSPEEQTKSRREDSRRTIHVSANDLETSPKPRRTNPHRNRGTAKGLDLNQLKFRRKAGKTILRLYGNKALTVQKVSVASGKQLRLVVEGHTASAKVLRSRAGARGVQVSHVKKGDRSILIVLDLDDGWYAQDPQSRRNGAEIVFARR